ncbi:putative integral inner membrane protein [Marinilactibacillus psychrotolerans]|uniref:mechanosensitive ion channel n=1 Tax=Marinilactibacillus psychrotolerans TaxID=191770 RepID=UPI001C7D4354|nr:mechanosensitive ion channel [Marinilactibacillus psychrotolerans]GEQ34212.1 putative integral inner membrane protein [Marinilactibacillus psychrotolerans]
MDNVGNSVQNGFNSFVDYLPQLLLGIVLIIVAWIVATLVGKAVSKGLKAIGIGKYFQKWGATKTEEQSHALIDTLSKVAYYLVWVLFLPGIFSTFGLDSIGQPIMNMIDTVLVFIPNIIAAGIVLVLGLFAAKLVKNLVYNVAIAANIDKHLAKLTGGDTNDAEVKKNKRTLASVLANIVYFLIVIPIILVALEVLNINSIAEPISSVLNTILSAIPNILVAVVLLIVGFAIAKFAGMILTDLLKSAGLNKYSSYLKKSSNMNLDLAKIAGQTVAVLIGLFFLVEALNALNLEMLNSILSVVIGYLPNVLFATIIIGLGFVGGQMLSSAIKNTTGSMLAGMLVKYILIIFSIFMALDQLNFASAIVQAAFICIIGGLAVAFALSFGLGGREFAKKQLSRLDNKIDEEANKSNTKEID